MLNRVRSLGLLINLVYILFVMIYSGHMLYFKDSVRPQVLAASSSISNTEILPNKTEREVAELVNKNRLDSNLPALRIDEQLQRVAKERANDMATSHYYGHRSPGGKYYFDLLDQKFKDGYSCENLELEFINNSELFVGQWMSSQKHQDCLLNNSVNSAGYSYTELEYGESQHIYTAYLVVAIYANN